MEHVEQSPLDRTALQKCTIAALSLAALLTMFHFWSLRRHWKRSESNKSEKWSVAVTASNLGILMLRVLTSFSCWSAVAIWTVKLVLYLVSRGINTLFLVHRAKCVQGPNPILSEKWFTKYIPRCLYIYYGILCIGNFHYTSSNPNMTQSQLPR